jgi:hypothetical protein
LEEIIRKFGFGGNLEEILEVRRKFEGNSQIRALFLKVLRIRQFPRKCAAKYAENPVLRDVKSENFLGEDPHCVIL